MDLVDRRWVYGHRVVGKHDEVGELALLDGALVRLLAELLGAPERDHLHRFIGSDSLVGADDRSGPRRAIHGCPHDLHQIG